jgi:hypothetical protein
MKTGTKIGLAIGLIFACALVFWLFLKFGGRTPSRYLGASARQVITIPKMKALAGNVNMWFDEEHGATIKDITYCAEDGYYYTAEYRDISPFEGVIRWVPFDEGSDLIQSRKFSRFGVDVVNLKVPQGFRAMYGVSIVSRSGERIKNLTYYSDQGTILAKEYREGIVDRFMSGYIEVKGGAALPPPAGTECDRTYAAEK